MKIRIELSEEQRGRLLAFAASRGERRLSRLVREALEAYIGPAGKSPRAAKRRGRRAGPDPLVQLERSLRILAKRLAVTG